MRRAAGGAPNVVLTPHIGGLSERSIARMTEQATERVLAALAGLPTALVANPAVLDRGAAMSGGAHVAAGASMARDVRSPLDSGDARRVTVPHSGEVVGSLRSPGARARARARPAAAAARRCAGCRLTSAPRSCSARRPASIATSSELARTITAEQGKTPAEAAAEAGRIPGSSGCAPRRRRGAGRRCSRWTRRPVGAGRLGYTRPEPTGVVAAITPFNYPAILVIHKIGPALAAGNAVIVKPAGATPLTARFLVERLRARRAPGRRAAVRRRPAARPRRRPVRRRPRAEDLVHRHRAGRPRDRARGRAPSG